MIETILTIAGMTILMAVLSRQAGGCFGADKLPDELTWLPEMAIGAIFGAFAYVHCPQYIIDLHEYARPITAALCTAWAYIWFQTGHAAFYGMGAQDNYNFNRKQTLSPIVDALAEPGTLLHGAVGTGLKSLLIVFLTAAVTVKPLLFAAGLIAMPLGYYLGWYVLPRKPFAQTEWGEIIHGAILGLALGILW